jgi:transcriptional regulator with XRE-family HTH domain
MAQMLDVSESQLAKWESGRTTPRAKSLTMYVELGLLTPGQALGLDPVEAVDATGEEDAA